MSPSSPSDVRVRFAPSPTGYLHVGNARTALFNWLFARGKGGAFILRIEDTDVERSEERYEAQLIDDLHWLGLDWDEGPGSSPQPRRAGEGEYAPYRQSERTTLYQEHAAQLLREGKAYYCFCTVEELEAERQRAATEHRQPIYSGKCRGIPLDGAEKRRASGAAAAVRLRVPPHPIQFHDMVRGTIEFPADVVSDEIIVRSSGMPMYNFVVVIDDALMKITYVVRGDDHVSNTPKQVVIYQAFGWPVPEFAHLSTILGPDHQRLSKRHGATSISNFRDMGIMPEALMNYLALLGWAPSGGTRETFTAKELIAEFSLQRVTPSPAVFDMEKLHWLNRHYLRASPPERVLALAREFLARAGFLGDTPSSEAAGLWLQHLIDLYLPSVDRLDQLPARVTSLFQYDAASALATPDNAEVMGWPSTPAVLQAFAGRISGLAAGSLSAETFKSILNEVKMETGVKGKELFHPIRTVVTGSHSGPEFDKLIPLIEQGSRLPLPMHVKSVHERVQEFMGSFGR